MMTEFQTYQAFESPVVSSTPSNLYIGGDWVPAASGERFLVEDPALAEPIASVADAGIPDAMKALEAATRAQRAWSALSPRCRSELLRRAYELMIEERDQLAELIVRENGKALTDAQSEVMYAAEFFRWYAEEAVRALGTVQTAPSGDNQIMVLRQPVGVAVLVTPWNFPAAMATRKIAPALAAGCSVILKPASDTPLTALAIAALLAKAGVMPGVVNVLPSRKSGPLVAALLDDCRVRKLSFTGSTEVGRVLLAGAARTVVNTSMELGGNAPFVVLADADLDDAVTGALVAKMRNGGEACTAANRFYVHRSIAGEFSDRLAYAMRRLVVGAGMAPNTQVGPMINAKARTKVASLVQGAADIGARVIAGGDAPIRIGYYYNPTVLADVPIDAPILREEIFGPVAPVVPFDSVDEVLAAANATEYGLVSYVYSRDLAAALRLAESLESGMVGINRGVVSDPAAPFGGVKQSGIGREGGHDGLLEFMESKYIAVSW